MDELLSAISVFLVFLIYLLNSIEKETVESLRNRMPEIEQTEKLKTYISDLKIILYGKIMPASFVFLITFYILLPKTIKIIFSSSLIFWDFDELKTLFVFIEFGLLYLSYNGLKMTFKLFNKLRKYS